MSIHLTRIYTRSGDSGSTSLTTGERVSKSHPRLEAYGTLDELNAFVGRLCTLCQMDAQAERLSPAIAELQRIQSDLFDMGTLLATPEGQGWPGMPTLDEQASARLENWIDAMNQEVPALQTFVLPGGCLVNAEAHVCRTVCRRLERLLVHIDSQGTTVAPPLIAYINRLSDYLFVFSRWASIRLGAPEVLWQPNRSDGRDA